NYYLFLYLVLSYIQRRLVKIIRKKRLVLKAARVRKGLRQSDLAKIMAVSQQTIAKWEQGRNCSKTFKQIRLLENVLEVPMQELFPDIFEEVELCQNVR